MTPNRPAPPPIRTSADNAFAHNTMRVRIPNILREVHELNPDFPVSIQRSLDRLRAGIEEDKPIPLLELPAHDYEEWAEVYHARAGDTWHNTDWFFAETYVYRLLMSATRWWETGRDPFAPKKQEEIDSPALWSALGTALDRRRTTREERLAAILQSALWGNRIDLSFAASLARGVTWSDDDLLVDDHERAVEHLLRRRGTVHIVHDNTGTELAMDLALADVLLNEIVEQVVLHLKAHPTFVSDAIVPDVLAFFRALLERDEPFVRLGERLIAAHMQGRLRFAPDPFWNSSRFLWETPPRLRQLFTRAAMVIIKGDANYRRVVGDALWQPHTPLADVVGDFPAPVLLLRTMKSDPVVGLADGLAARLDSIDPDWRINGRRGVLQMT